MRFHASTKLLSAVLALALGIALTLFPTTAGEQDHGTWFTFSQPIVVPGQVLPAGTYWFQIYDNKTTARQNIISISDHKKSHVANVAAVPAMRPDAIDGTVS